MRVIMTGGGTGGHVYPAIAIADRIRKEEPDSAILFLGSRVGIEEEAVSRAGYDIQIIPARWFDRGFGAVKDTVEFIKASAVSAVGIFDALGRMRRFRPDVIVGTGGFVSLPVLIAGHIYGAGCLTHEQNACPGLSNRIASRYVDEILLGFDGTGSKFRKPQKTVYTGNPVRDGFRGADRRAARERLGIPEDDFTVFSFGGSLGSEKLNEIAAAYMHRAVALTGRTLIFATGQRYYDDVRSEAAEAGISDDGPVRFSAYIDDMQDCIAAADLLICRAGALSMAEIAAAGRAAIFIPYPLAADDHQYYNAKAVADRGGAVLIREKDAATERILNEIERLAADTGALRRMEAASLACAPEDAAGAIYREIRKVYERKRGKSDRT